jgi:hypothetical protein
LRLPINLHGYVLPNLDGHDKSLASVLMREGLLSEGENP